MQVATLTKRCPRCKVTKPWSDFYPRTYWDDGMVRSIHAYCKPCNAAKRSESYARHPGSKAASCRAYRERLAQDPARLAEYREKQGFYVRAWNLRRGRNVGRYTDIGHAGFVPIGPFVKWLRTLGDRPTDIALASGIFPRQVDRYLSGEQPRVSLDVVDRACIHADASLEDLYPYEEVAA